MSPNAVLKKPKRKAPTVLSFRDDKRKESVNGTIYGVSPQEAYQVAVSAIIAKYPNAQLPIDPSPQSSN